jgi:hypothetical protein
LNSLQFAIEFSSVILFLATLGFQRGSDFSAI